MDECDYCGSQFKIVFEDDDEEVQYCPSCGESIELEEDGEEEDYYDEE